MMRREVTLVLALLIAAQSALAGEGVVLITQADAVAGGVTAGDTPGFPVTISSSGSYRLASDLVVTSITETGVSITSTDVSLDLNGFAILGPVTCTGEGSSILCVNGMGWGIHSTNERISVRNGSVRGFGFGGVVLDDDCRVRDLTVQENSSSGISVGSGCIVRNSTASLNGVHGILTRPVVESRASVVSGNNARGNGDDGIHATTGSVVIDNMLSLNGDKGIWATTGSSVHRNSSAKNEGDGINLGAVTTTTLNATGWNGGYGISMAVSSAAYGFNVISVNTAGTVSASGTNFGNNNCQGNTTCP